MGGFCTIITSLQNEQVKHVVALHKNKGRKEYREFIIEGKRLLQEAIFRDVVVKEIYYNTEIAEDKLDVLIKKAEERNISVVSVTDKVFRRMSVTEEPQGILAVVEFSGCKISDLKIHNKSILLILDRIKDPGNLGTILRVALAAGVDQICLIEGTVDVYNPKVLRSSMGALFSQKIYNNTKPENIVDFCKSQKCSIVVSSMEGKSIFNTNISQLLPTALVIGNEACGVSDYFKNNATKALCIPMFNNVESLNAAMATGIFLYEMRRQGDFL